jgi:tetratricopeptide (TPR) repeat protein
MADAQTTLAVQRYLDELVGVEGDTPAEPIIRALLARSVHRLEMLCRKFLHRSYRKLITLKSPFSHVDHLLARELVAAGRWEEAITVLKAAIDNKDHWQFHLEMGKIYQAHGKVEAAVEAYQKVTTFKGKAHLVWEGMATILLDQGRFGEVRRTLESVLG